MFYDKNGALLVRPSGPNGDGVQFDDTDKMAVSLYGKETTEGDTPLTMAAPGEPNLRVSIMQGNAQVGVRSSAADAVSNSRGRAEIEASGLLFNGSSWDRARGNVDVTLGASAERTVATAWEMVNYNHRGLVIVVSVTARAAATTLTPSLEIKSIGAVDYARPFKIWQAAAAINTADGLIAYLFYPGLAADAAALYTEKVSLSLPRTSRLLITPSDANGVTYSVSGYWLV